MISPTTVPGPAVKPDQSRIPSSPAMSSASHANVNCWIDCESANVIVFAQSRANGLERNAANVECEGSRPPCSTSTGPDCVSDRDATSARCYRVSPYLPRDLNAGDSE